MIRPDIDGRAALRLRELPAVWEMLRPQERADICNRIADLLEEYILAYRGQP